MQHMNELIYEPINSNYGWAKYGDFKVIMEIDRGYINGTKLCHDGGKELFHWTRSQQGRFIPPQMEG